LGNVDASEEEIHEIIDVLTTQKESSTEMVNEHIDWALYELSLIE